MIDYIVGKPIELRPTSVVLDNHGIGYEVNITLLDYPKIENKEEVKLYIFESLREDAHVLYGFLERRSRELFIMLTSVSGVGPNTGRLILSSITTGQLEQAISSGQDSVLKSVKGIGAKTAQRIIVDLKDKIKIDEESLNTSTPVGEVYEDAVSALVMLGFTMQQSKKTLQKIFNTNPSLSTEQAIKQALTML